MFASGRSRGSILAALLARAACGTSPSPDDQPLTREYAKPFSEVSLIAANVLLEQGYRIVSDEHQNGEGRIDATRSGGGVAVRCRRIKPERTEVRLRMDGLPAKAGEDLLNRMTERVAAADESR